MIPDHKHAPSSPLRASFFKDEASAQHYSGLSATDFEAYTEGVGLDKHGRPPVGFDVFSTPFYETLTGIPAGTRGKVSWLFMNHTTPTFEVKWEAHEADYHGHRAEESAWFTAPDLLRYDLFGKFTRVEFYAEYWEEGRMKFHAFRSLREAAQWVLDNADWTDERGESGLLKRLHSGVYTQALGGRIGDGLERLGAASNYCPRALEIAVETNNWRSVIRRGQVEKLTYDA